MEIICRNPNISLSNDKEYVDVDKNTHLSDGQIPKLEFLGVVRHHSVWSIRDGRTCSQFPDEKRRHETTSSGNRPSDKQRVYR